MPVEILVPPLSQTMDTLILMEWAKEVGEPVTKGETLFRVETDKATLDVESPASGTLQEIYAQPGEEIKIRASIGMIAEAGDEKKGGSGLRPSQEQMDLPGEADRTPAGPLIPAALHAVGPLGEPLPPARLQRVFASPRARQLASQEGLFLEDSRIAGSGPQGLIVERDVRAFLQRAPVPPAAPVAATPVARRMAEKNEIDLSTLIPARPGTPITKADVEARLREVQAAPEPGLPGSAAFMPQQAEFERVPLSPARRTIARRMLESQTSSAAVTYMSEVDATRLVRLRQRLLDGLAHEAVRPTYTDFLVRILCLVMPAHPDLNATFDGETLLRWKAVHMALAVDTPRGLVAPVLRNAQALGVSELAQARTALVHSANENTLRPEDLSGGTFTLSNLGTLGVDTFTPILNPPQVAILGMGRIRQAPAAHKGKLRLRHRLGLSLTCDHRVVDGAPAARFLQDLCRLIEQPDLIWL